MCFVIFSYAQIKERYATISARFFVIVLTDGFGTTNEEAVIHAMDELAIRLPMLQEFQLV